MVSLLKLPHISRIVFRILSTLVLNIVLVQLPSEAESIKMTDEDQFWHQNCNIANRAHCFPRRHFPQSMAVRCGGWCDHTPGSGSHHAHTSSTTDSPGTAGNETYPRRPFCFVAKPSPLGFRPPKSGPPTFPKPFLNPTGSSEGGKWSPTPSGRQLRVCLFESPTHTVFAQVNCPKTNMARKQHQSRSVVGKPNIHLRTSCVPRPAK